MQSGPTPRFYPEKIIVPWKSGGTPDFLLDKQEQFLKQVLLSLADHPTSQLLGTQPAPDTMSF